MNRIKPAEQVYTNYSAEDFLVWKTLFSRQMKVLSGKASSDYLNAIEDIGFSADAIPDFSLVNERLGQFTGWRVITVTGICPPATFFKLLSQKIFTCTCWLRSMDELDYLEEPDMFHDVFGHLPLLTNQRFSDFFQSLGKLALEHLENDVVIDMLERLYWYTVEFGLIHEDDQLKIYGSGIISSLKEAENAFSNNVTVSPFNVRDILLRPFSTDVVQDHYFIITGFNQLMEALPVVERELAALSGRMEQQSKQVA